MDFKNKVVLVTGASSGIGEATAKLYAEHSAQLILIGRNEANLKKVAAECAKISGLEPVVIIADVTKDDDVKRIYEAAKRFGKLDVLVNNAGASLSGDILNPNLDNFDKTFDLNLRSVYHITSVLAPLLIASRGNIVNVSSALSKRVRLGHIGYSIAKAGLDHLTRQSALELAPKGVRVNTVNPGVTATKFFENVGLEKAACDDIMDDYTQRSPLRRVVEPREIGNVILFLSSDLSASTTGASFLVDAGMSLRS